MKNSSLKQIGWASVLLLLGAFSPLSTFAQEDEGCCKTTSEKVTGILDYMNEDITNRQHATALINFQAAENIKKYSLDQQLLFMVAPGTDWALSAGAVVGGTDTQLKALTIASTSIVGFFGAMAAPQSFVIPYLNITIGGTQQTAESTHILRMFAKMRDFFLEGDVSKLNSVNSAGLLFNSNLRTANISDQDAQDLISMLTNPFPNLNPDIQTKIRSVNPLTGELGIDSLTGLEKEEIAKQMASGAIMGLSTSAYADMVARRTPGLSASISPNAKSVMEIMDEYSKQRFVNPDWYKTIGAASEASLLREIAHMQAYSIWVQNQQFRVSEQQTALVAAMTSVLAKMDVLLTQIILEYRLAKQQAEAYKSQGSSDLKNFQLPSTP